MQKIFKNGSKGDNRRILIDIKDGTIWFYFYDQYVRELNYIKEEEQRRQECGEPELTQEEKCVHEFYWIDAHDWNKSKTENLDRGDNWHNHMTEKAWFTEEMENFLDLNAY